MLNNSLKIFVKQWRNNNDKRTTKKINNYELRKEISRHDLCRAIVGILFNYGKKDDKELCGKTNIINGSKVI